MEIVDIVKFDSSFHGQGWHNSESYHTETEEVFFKWMKSGVPCSVTLLSSNMVSCIVECDVMSIVSEQVLGYLEIEIDSQVVHWVVTNEGDSGVKLQFALPTKLEGTCQVTFFVRKEFFASQEDLRPLSLAFREIKVKKMDFAGCMGLIEVKV